MRCVVNLIKAGLSFVEVMSPPESSSSPVELTCHWSGMVVSVVSEIRYLGEDPRSCVHISSLCEVLAVSVTTAETDTEDEEAMYWEPVFVMTEDEGVAVFNFV